MNNTVISDFFLQFKLSLIIFIWKDNKQQEENDEKQNNKLFHTA